MDETEKYFLMCEQAEEIQIIGGAKATELDDWYYEKSTQYFSIGTFTNEYDIWLPRQDQLQDMLKTTHLTNPYNLIGFLWNVLNEDETCPEETPCEECIKEAVYWRSFKTLEQLWLAFIMHEKFNKIWNGNNWILGEVRMGTSYYELKEPITYLGIIDKFGGYYKISIWINHSLSGTLMIRKEELRDSLEIFKSDKIIYHGHYGGIHKGEVIKKMNETNNLIVISECGEIIQVEELEKRKESNARH